MVIAVMVMAILAQITIRTIATINLCAQLMTAANVTIIIVLHDLIINLVIDLIAPVTIITILNFISVSMH